MSGSFIRSVKRLFGGSRFVAVLKNKYILATFFFLVWILFFDSNNLFTWYSNLREVAAQEKQKKYYRESIRRTDEMLQELSSNRDSLEKFAREQYLFHKDDEDVFVIKE